GSRWTQKGAVSIIVGNEGRGRGNARLHPAAPRCGETRHSVLRAYNTASTSYGRKENCGPVQVVHFWEGVVDVK
ncbi:unnamed protein product, partial [Ectocarpus fasciculatus]